MRQTRISQQQIEALLNFLLTPPRPNVENVKVFYHGTIDKFVPEILEKGLQPLKQNGWNATMETARGRTINPSKDDVPGFVYMTLDEAWAHRYAEGKAAYFRAKPGEKFTIGSLDMIKAEDAPVIPDAKPTILRIHADEHVRASLVYDERDVMGSKLEGSVPPSLIEVDTDAPKELTGIAAEIS